MDLVQNMNHATNVDTLVLLGDRRMGRMVGSTTETHYPHLDGIML